MARLPRNIVRLVVVLATAGALVATALGAIGYSTFRLAHDVATASELRLPNLVTDAAVPSVIYAANGTVMATLRSSLNRQPVSLDQISPDPDRKRSSTPKTTAFGTTGASTLSRWCGPRWQT